MNRIKESFEFWCKLMSHHECNSSYTYKYHNFWLSLNEGQIQMEDEFAWKKMFENPEVIYLSLEDYESLNKKLNDPQVIRNAKKSIQKLLERKDSWDEVSD